MFRLNSKPLRAFHALYAIDFREMGKNKTIW